MASLFGVAAAFWGVVMALAPLLQVRRMIARRSSADLSLGYFGVLLPGFVLWVGYGWTRGDWALLVPNTVALSVGAATIVVGLVLRRRQRPADEARPRRPAHDGRQQPPAHDGRRQRPADEARPRRPAHDGRLQRPPHDGAGTMLTATSPPDAPKDGHDDG